MRLYVSFRLFGVEFYKRKAFSTYNNQMKAEGINLFEEGKAKIYTKFIEKNIEGQRI
jgi:hypothetical protein